MENYNSKQGKYFFSLSSRYAVTHPRFRAELDKMFCVSRADGSASMIRRRKTEMPSECETVQMDDKDIRKKPVMRNDSSVCEESIMD